MKPTPEFSPKNPVDGSREHRSVPYSMEMQAAAPHEVPRTPMSDHVPPAAHEIRPRAPAEMHGTADGGWDGDDGSVMSTRLGLGGVARQTQR